MDNVFARTHELLNKIKDQKNAHQLDLKNFRALFTENPQSVSKAIQNCLLQVLPVFKKHPQSEKAVRATVTMLEELLSIYKTDDEKQMNNEIFRTLVAVFTLLLQGGEAKEKAIRQGCAYVLERFCALGIQDVIQMPLVKLQQRDALIIQLLRDKDNQVRVLAAKLAKFSINDLVTDELMRAMSQERSPDVRKNAIRSIRLTDARGFNNIAFQAVLERLRDKDEFVRLKAWTRVSEARFQELDIEYRRRIIVSGMVDRSEKVRDACKLYIKGFLTWFEEETKQRQENFGPQHAPVVFMTLMGIDDLPLEMEQGVSKALAFIIKELMTTDSMVKLIEEDLRQAMIGVLRDSSPIENTHLLLLRYMLQCLKTQGLIKTEDLVPDMPTMCKLLEYYTNSQDVFKLHQVMLITKCMDLAEEIPKRSLIERLKGVLIELPISVNFDEDYSKVISAQYHEIGSGVEFVRTSVQLVDQVTIYLRELLSDHEAEFSRNLIEVINEVRDPLMQPLEQDDPVSQICEDRRNPNLFDKKEYLQTQQAHYADEIEALKGEMELQIQNDRFPEAKQTKERLQHLIDANEKAGEQLTELTEMMHVLLMKSLLITTALLRHCKQDFITDEIMELTNTLVKPSLELDRCEIRCVAVECVGLYAMLRKELCIRYFSMFKFVIEQKENKLMVWYALKAVLDIFMLHDFLNAEAANQDVNMEEETRAASPTELFALVIDFLYGDDDDIRALVSEGVAKLLLLKRLPHPEHAMARLLLLSCDSTCPKHASQILQPFFFTYPFYCEENTTTLEESFKLAVSLYRRITERSNAGRKDALLPGQINVNKMFEFAYTYTDWDMLQSQGPDHYVPKRHFHFALFNFFAMEALQDVSADVRKLYVTIACQSKLQGIGSREVHLATILLEALKDKVEVRERKGILKLKDVVNVREAEVHAINDPDFNDAQREAWEQSRSQCNEFIKTVLKLEESDLVRPVTLQAFDDPLEVEEDDSPPIKRSPSNQDANESGKRMKRD